jgi:HD-GYP domain-containing protein (c-di-GMP phosphodiesterase class II)
VSQAASLARLIETNRADVVANAVAALPQSTYTALALSERTVDGCVQAVTKALRTKSPREIRRWLNYELQSPTPEDLLVCLNAAIDQIASGMQASRDSKTTQILRFLDWVRSDANRYLDETFPKKVPIMIGEDAEGIMDGLVQVMSVHEPEVAVHLDASAELATRLAGALGLDERAVACIRAAARLHDIGQIAVDAQVLGKAGPLSESEALMIDQHPEKAAAIVEGIPALAELAPIIRGHHERIDGTGYPDGKVGDDIPPGSRIIAVVDAFHTMTTAHPAREAVSVERALAELNANAGTQFDVDVVEAFIAMFGFSRIDIRGIA